MYFLWTRRWMYPLAAAMRSIVTAPISTLRVLPRPIPAVWRSPLTRKSLCALSSPSLLPEAKDVEAASSLLCAGCGAQLQTRDNRLPGFTPEQKITKLENTIHDADSVSNAEIISDAKTEPLICQRCFSLKHYNTALNISLKADDYLTHLSILKEKRALILLMVDVTDYPASVFPSISILISPSSRVLIVANKTDLLPKNTTKQFWKDFEQIVLTETTSSSLTGCDVMGVRFISARTGHGLEELCEEITNSWGNRGDVYLLGCTNVGKSTLFNTLLSRLCGAKPGQLSTSANMSAPMATISQWPGTTLGLLSFPLLSVGKIKRLRQQQMRSQQTQNDYYEDDDLEQLAFDDENILTPKEAKRLKQESTDVADVLEELGIGKRRKPSLEARPSNKYWLHDTPGAINNAQLINLLTTKELKLALSKKPLKPRTFILKPEQCLFIGGLARLDYLQGSDSAYFTVFASSYLPVHTSKMSKADTVYQNLLGSPMLKIPLNEPEGRLQSFPPLESQDFCLTGESWKRSTVDIVLSSAGWVSVTLGPELVATVRGHTPHGKGMVIRTPSLYPEAINERGKRSKSDNTRAMFRGK
ncbi:nitric oxide-associated protein 1-like [Halichondria panicea]|uniref:nitric oxide-associated protein 1-like n=1 Tax=Halichondria panicea TaxID=6063 RepID=UPI00312B5134